MRTILFGFMLLFPTFGQTQRPEFEVASIKPSLPPDGQAILVACHGLPATNEPGLFACQNLNLSAFITMAYGIARYQLSAPDWMLMANFDLRARLPEGTTKENAKVMLQNLLADRFKFDGPS